MKRVRYLQAAVHLRGGEVKNNKAIIKKKRPASSGVPRGRRSKKKKQ
jgi:hypothetical protein